jgi:hypothetical protein
VAALAITGAGVWLAFRPGPPPAKESAVVEPDVSAPAVPSALPPPAPVRRQPLPALDAPVARVLPELERRAAAGEAAAACRIAAELQSCGGLALQQQDFDRWLGERRRALELSVNGADPEAARVVNETFERELALREQQLARAGSHCEDVPPPAALDQIQRWRNAARMGSATAMRQYASGNVFRWSTILETAPALAAYRAEAEPMALAMARSGDLEMNLLLAAAYSPLPSRSRSLLGQAVQRDGAKSLLMYRRVLAHLQAIDSHEARRLATDIGNQIEQLEQSLPDADRARATGLERETTGQWRPLRDRGVRPYTSALGEPTAARPADCGR